VLFVEQQLTIQLVEGQEVLVVPIVFVFEVS